MKLQTTVELLLLHFMDSLITLGLNFGHFLSQIASADYSKITPASFGIVMVSIERNKRLKVIEVNEQEQKYLK